MSHKQYLSEKKTTRMTITTSAALKDWIKRYVKSKQRESPLDKRYQSISSFCHETLEEVMKIYEKGKNLDDFQRLVNQDVRNFFDQLSTSVHLPILEDYAKPSKYFEIDYTKLMRILILSKQFYTKDMNPYDINSLYDSFDRIKDRYLELGITKSLEIQITPFRDSKHYHCVLEHVGLPKSGFPVNNIHIVHCKLLLLMMGFLGLKVENLVSSYNELYSRIEMVTTNLFFENKLLKKERLTLVKDNVKFLINFSRIIADDDFQLWMKLATSKSCIIDFKSEKAFNDWILTIENDIKDFNYDLSGKIKILKFFEKIHWIQLFEDVNSFYFEINVGLSNKAKEMLIKYLTENFKLEYDKNNYYISK
ncbi:MAG: hypothetical protein EU531_06670 [Promethearchaeota archaeon]|nr:MAG: hypothetical protein EU531_06670 [Candidatus Lokiarchaeota archaeon]